MKQVLKDVLCLAVKKKWEFGDMLDYIRNYTKYNDITLRELDKLWVEVEKMRAETPIKTEIILQHTIEYWFDNDSLELNDIDIEHIKECIEDGYNQGELNQLVNGKHGDEEVRGWWNIALK